MKLLQRRARRREPQAKSIRPAQDYLARGADEARRLGHNYIGTEHVLLALARDPYGDAATLLRQLGVVPAAVDETLTGWLCGAGPSRKIDPEALAELGIDFDTVRERLEQTFGPGALERSQSSCLGMAPRLKLALAYALDRASSRKLADEHVLLGLLDVPDSIAARALTELGITLESAEAALDAKR
jgi:ATP-dependent Clp protease ATP-binding subunit ClpA